MSKSIKLSIAKMIDLLKRNHRHKRNLSDWIEDYDQRSYSNLKDDDSKDILIDNYNDCSDLRRSFHDSIKNIFEDLSLKKLKNIYKNNNFYTINYPNNDKNKKYFYNGEITLVNNNSVNKYGIKNNKLINMNQNHSQKKYYNSKQNSDFRKKKNDAPRSIRRIWNQL